MNDIHSPHTGRKRDRFYQEILESLMRPYSASGSFSKETKNCKGETIVHQFSLATGMMFSGAETRYRNQLHDHVPLWVDTLHPVLAMRLFDCAISFGKPLPATEDELAVSATGAIKRLPCIDELLKWAIDYRGMDSWLDLRQSRKLRQLIGADPMFAVMTVLVDTNGARRDLVLAAFRQLYEVEQAFNEPWARWAHDQLGGWFRHELESALGKESSRWPFRHPDHALETTA